MENTTSTSNSAVEQAPAKTVALANSADLSQLLSQSKGADLDKKKAVITLNAEYIQIAKPGDKFRGLFYGLTTVEMNDKTSNEPGAKKILPTVQLIRDGKLYLNSGVNLVNTIKSANLPQGAAIEIEFTKEDGDVKVYDVRLLG